MIKKHQNTYISEKSKKTNGYCASISKKKKKNPNPNKEIGTDWTKKQTENEFCIDEMKERAMNRNLPGEKGVNPERRGVKLNG